MRYNPDEQRHTHIKSSTNYYYYRIDKRCCDKVEPTVEVQIGIWVHFETIFKNPINLSALDLDIIWFWISTFIHIKNINRFVFYNRIGKSWHSK